MWRYFNLNHRRQPDGAFSSPSLERRGMFPDETGSDTAVKPSVQARSLPLWEQLMMYAGAVIGVLFSSAVRQLKEGAPTSLNFSYTSILVSAVVSLIIIPAMYEKLKVQPDSPFLVRFGLFVQHGVFWNVLFGALGKAMGG